MPTSGSYSFSPSFADAALLAFRRIGISRNDVKAEGLLDASLEANAMMTTWANRGPNLWAVDSVSIPLIPGQASYAIDPATVMVLDAYVTSGSPATDRILTPISRSDYAEYPNKLQQGRPTVFWFDRLTAPTVTLWPVPDTATAYTLNFFRSRQTQTSVVAGGTAPDVPGRWFDAFVWGLAERLAFIYAPDRAQVASGEASKAYAIAADQDTENAPLRITADMRGYWR